MTEQATFAAGCFWGVEEAFRITEGVSATQVGYIGGDIEQPTYQDVCSGTTNHAEAVLVTFDPEIVSYADLLERFWKVHNPTTLNRQGPDIGTQYRSAIFYHSPEQQEAAERSIAQQEAAHRFPAPIVTEVLPAPPFYKAEEYHQQYSKKHGHHCAI